MVALYGGRHLGEPLPRRHHRRPGPALVAAGAGVAGAVHLRPALPAAAGAAGSRLQSGKNAGPAGGGLPGLAAGQPGQRHRTAGHDRQCGRVPPAAAAATLHAGHALALRRAPAGGRGRRRLARPHRSAGLLAGAAGGPAQRRGGVPGLPAARPAATLAQPGSLAPWARRRKADGFRLPQRGTQKRGIPALRPLARWGLHQLLLLRLCDRRIAHPPQRRGPERGLQPGGSHALRHDRPRRVGRGV